MDIFSCRQSRGSSRKDFSGGGWGGCSSHLKFFQRFSVLLKYVVAYTSDCAVAYAVTYAVANAVAYEVAYAVAYAVAYSVTYAVAYAVTYAVACCLN